MRFSPRRLALAVVAFLLLSACGGNVEFSFGGETAGEAAVKLIEGEAMSQRLDVGAISAAVCEEPATNDVDEVFACTGETDDGTINFEVTIEEEDRIFATPSNVVHARFLEDYATSAVDALNLENSLNLAPGSIDCGDETVVLDQDMQMTCVLTDPEAGGVFDAVMTIRDVNLGTFGVEIAERSDN